MAVKTYSKSALVSQTISFDIDTYFNHLVVGCTYYTDETKSTVATNTAGTIVVEGQVNGNSGWSALDASPLDCADPASFSSTSIPLSRIRFVPSNIDVATHYQITVTANSH